jgi:spermidine/putrescine-binding protein
MINLTLIQSADFIRIMNQHPDLPFKFFVPHYYNLLVCEYLAITNSAKNTDACYLFINFLLEKEQLEDMTKKNFWFHPRKDLKLGDSPLYNQIASDTEKNKNKSYYTDTLLNKKEILTLIMNLKS